MTDPIFGPFTFVILFITMIHFPILGLILIIWAQDQLKKRDLEVYARLEGIAKDLGVLNRTFPPQKGLFLFSWLVYQKRVRDYYIKYNNKQNPPSLFKHLYIKWESNHKKTHQHIGNKWTQRETEKKKRKGKL